MRGKIDRVDVFADGTFRVIDYKRGNSAPSGSKALQLPIYALAVEQASRAAGGPLSVREALYMALGPRGAESRVIKPATREAVVAGAQARVARRPSRASSAASSRRARARFTSARGARSPTVCRKDYVSDGEAASA